MSGANLSEANISGCNLERALMSSATLNGAQMLGIKLMRANLVDASLVGCNFEDPCGRRANCEGQSPISVTPHVFQPISAESHVFQTLVSGFCPIANSIREMNALTVLAYIRNQMCESSFANINTCQERGAEGQA